MLTIRPATAADIPELHAVIERAYRGSTARLGWTHEADILDGPRTDRETLMAMIADPVNTILLALDGIGIVACIQVTDQGGGLAYFGQLAVMPGRQADGLGRRMIAAAETHARSFGATRIEGTVIDRRDELIAYYGRCGFTATGEIRPFPYAKPISGPPLTLVVLAKPL